MPHGQGAADDVVHGHRAALAVRHLVQRGHREVVYVSGPMHLAQCRDRREGALLALAEAGLPAGALAQVETARLDAAAGRDAGARLLGMAALPSAVFCANDMLALGVLQSLYGAG
ncbi:substrate-binding domain-containing protein, partial [Streptomyces sp. t39]|uniref:substrate-binding domain-containing protein n=1 Tax=Streptomyces sp. t39 TaxID=1828156 RepID=UPI00164F87AB